MNTNLIGQAIRKYRHEKNLSQDGLAKLSGISYHTVVKLEKPGIPANPSALTLMKIAKVLSIPIQDLLPREE